MILIWDRVPLIQAAKRREVANREAAFKGTPYRICGMVVRQMTVRDFLILDARQSPFVQARKTPPTLPELAEFFWMLSPEIDQWHEEKSWRKPWLIPSLEKIQAYFYGRKLRRVNAEAATRECFQFVEDMFQDAPPGSSVKGEQYITYLAGWCDTLRSEYQCSEEEIFRMPLPKLFNYLRAMELRKNPEPRLFNRHSMAIKQAILRGINRKIWKPEDVMSESFTLN